MICRNCSAVIPDDSELCPSCGHNPAKRGRSRKAAVIVLLLSLIIFSSCVMIAVRINRNPAGTETTAGYSSSGTTAFFALKSTSAPSETAEPETTDTEKESVSGSGVAKSTESFRNFQVETFEISASANETKAQRARIKADKEDFLINGEEYLEYICRNIITKNSYVWLTIDFGDDTGIVFLSDNTGGADYGKIDENGLIRELYGSFIISRQANYSYYPAIVTASKTEPEKTSSDTATSESKAPATETTVSDALATAGVTTSEAKTEKPSDTAAETKPTEKKTAEPQSSKTTSAVTASSKSVASSAVYITATGSKFHRDGCGSLSKSKIKIDRNEALEKGYEPCKRCNP